jgi:ribonuclease D
MTYRLITDESSLRHAASKLQSEPRIALDCEAAGFHRYTDRLCLVQLSTPRDTYLFDPLESDPAPVLKPLLEDPAVQVVMHGADFDLRLLRRDLEIEVRGLFDTQVAATLLGVTAVGLASLLAERMNVELSKRHQRADWAQRPLSDGLLEYAADDTRHLLALADMLAAELTDRDREDWAAEEFRFLESIEWVEETQDPMTRFKAARKMTPREVTSLRAAVEWRDRIARERDRAPFRVVGDPVLLDIVAQRPRSVRELSSMKGVSPRLAQGHGEDLLAALEKVDGLSDHDLRPCPKGPRNSSARFTPEEEAVAERIRELRAIRAGELGLDKGVLLSNTQITEIVRGGPRTLDALVKLPGIRRWQAQLLGTEVLEILLG